MESPRMYEEGSPDIISKDFTKSVFTFTEESDHHIALDPTLENAVVDLQELINTAIPALETVGGPITIDNLFGFNSSDLELLEGGHTSVNQNITDISKFVPETVQGVCMTNSDEVVSNHNNSRQILTIKSEDLDLTACQRPSPLEIKIEEAFAASPCQGAIPSAVKVEETFAASPSQSTRTSRQQTTSVSSTYSGSSRGSSPKSPIVYECRKPGRKPSAGGPVRNRKREPPKNTSEYFEKRARNNVAVRKSREKAKLRQGETEKRVSDLCSENEKLQKKVDLLTKELNVLKSLFINVGASLPDNFEEIINS